MDLPAACRPVVRAEVLVDDAIKLIDQLCTFAGMILEDVHETAIVAGAAEDLAARIEVIHAAAADVLILTRAASVIAARYG